MIAKEDVLKNFSKDDFDVVTKVYEMVSISYKKDISNFTKYFVKPNIWSYFIKEFNCGLLNVEASGGYEECDRKMISINRDIYGEYPFQFIKICNKSKFNILKHKDYLGAIMSLGIEREKMGDLRVIDNYAVVPVCEDILSYICNTLTTVGNAPISIERIDHNDIPKSNFCESTIIIPSLRIDNFVSKLAKVSRNKALSFIDENKVLLDYIKTKDKSKEIKEGQTITISGVGKFIVGSIIGNTKSGNCKVNVRKYI